MDLQTITELSEEPFYRSGMRIDKNRRVGGVRTFWKRDALLNPHGMKQQQESSDPTFRAFEGLAVFLTEAI